MFSANEMQSNFLKSSNADDDVMLYDVLCKSDSVQKKHHYTMMSMCTLLIRGD